MKLFIYKPISAHIEIYGTPIKQQFPKFNKVRSTSMFIYSDAEIHNPVLIHKCKFESCIFFTELNYSLN